MDYAKEKQITGFKKEGRRNPKIVVLLDGEPWVTLDPETVVRERLRTGQGLSVGRRAQILAADEVIAARKAAAGHAAHTPKTRRELEQFLRERKFSAQATQAALETLSASGTVDDERVTQSFIDSRRRRKLGPRRIEAELRQRGVAGNVVEKRVEESFAEADLAGECLELARRYARRYQPLDEQAQRNKLVQFLLRRGYASGPVWSAVRQLCAEQKIENEDEAPDET